MWFRYIFVVILFSIPLADIAFAQDTPAKKDSTKIYRDIETYSKKSKSTRFLYDFLFVPVSKPGAQKIKPKAGKKKTIQNSYRSFEGKIIRNIFITTLDPFGYSVTDTINAAKNILLKVGNSAHVKTQRLAIQNLLLIHKNEPFDSLLVKESERLIRSQGYVHEVLFRSVLAGKKSDSVDIYIRELDSWSLRPAFAVSTSRYTIDLKDINILGTGHQFQNVFTRDYIAGKNSFYTNYHIPSIRNTYISTTLHYSRDAENTTTRSIGVDRPFFSPFAKWAAGVVLFQQFRNNSVHVGDSMLVEQNIRYNMQDYWAGKSQQVFKGTSEDARMTHFIFTGRYLRIHYLEKPVERIDWFPAYADETFYMASAGISTRKYSEDKYIFKFGPTEDVPVGGVYSVTGGYQVRNNIGRIYAGARISFGNYTDWGYLSCNFEYGTFFRSSQPEQSVFTAGVNYFTDLLEIGKWKLRQFVKPLIVVGMNRFTNENITINNENGLPGFSTSALAGTKKIAVTFQTQTYAPWNIWGFRFGPYLIYSLGILGNDNTGFKNNHMYSQFALGVLIKNEFLVFNYLQFSVSFYPVVPGVGDNVFKINSSSTTDFGFRDFIIGKPATVAYQ